MLIPDTTNAGAAQIVAPSDGGLEALIPVERLDDQCFIADPSLIKIDVEGMESDVIAGASKLLERCKSTIYAEVNSIAKGLPVLEWAIDFGYLCFGCSHAAFNPNNFFGSKENFFGEARECALLLIHPERLGDELYQRRSTEAPSMQYPMSINWPICLSPSPSIFLTSNSHKHRIRPRIDNSLFPRRHTIVHEFRSIA